MNIMGSKVKKKFFQKKKERNELNDRVIGLKREIKGQTHEKWANEWKEKIE